MAAGTVGPNAGLTRVMELMREIFRGMTQQQDEALLHTDLSMAQVKALLAVGKEGDPSMGMVAKELNIGLSAASQIVERLVKAGLVERRPNPSDRRITQCVLSPEGERLWQRLRTGSQRLRLIVERLAPDDLASLERGLSALANEIQVARVEGEG
jgi:DNA-binding MarR family transcriptional regulator